MHDVCGRLQPDWRSHRPSQPSRAVSPCLTTRSSVLASIERLDESVRVCIYTCRPHSIKDRTLNDAKECRQPWNDSNPPPRIQSPFFLFSILFIFFFSKFCLFFSSSSFARSPSTRSTGKCNGIVRITHNAALTTVEGNTRKTALLSDLARFYFFETFFFFSFLNVIFKSVSFSFVVCFYSPEKLAIDPTRAECFCDPDNLFVIRSSNNILHVHIHTCTV